MPDSVDVDTVLLLMEHYLEMHHKQIQAATERLVALAASIGVEKKTDEDLDSLVARVRKLAGGEFPDEEPPTKREKAILRQHVTLPVLSAMPTGPAAPPSEDIPTVDIPEASGPQSPTSVTASPSGAPMGFTGPSPIGVTGAKITPTGPYAPMGVTGATGPSGPPYEPLHHKQQLPFGGSMECMKQGSRLGIMYRDQGGRLGDWIAVFEGDDYKFPTDPAKPWMGNGPPEKISLLGKPLVGSEALCIAAAYEWSRHEQRVGSAIQSKALDLYQKHCSDGVWLDFLEDAKKTFHVAGVMTS